MLFFSSRLGCAASLGITIVATILLLFVFGGFGKLW